MSNIVTNIAELLYHSGCLKFGSFKIKSGASSPYYIDLSCLLSSPKDLCNIARIIAATIRRIATFDRIDKLASIELRGALILPSIACELDLPCTVVRKEEKAYGVTGRITGSPVMKGEHILFFDDVLSEGMSKLEGIRPLEQLGAQVENVVVVVNREQHGKENLEQMGYRVHALARISELAESLLQNSRISTEQASAVLNYVKNS